MKEKVDDNVKERQWDFRLKIINTFITVAGFAAIIIQLNQFYSQNKTIQKQTELLKQSLVQTYRPIGVISYSNPLAKNKDHKYLKVDSRKDTLTNEVLNNITFSPFLVNKGKGILVYIGHIYYATDVEYSFRERVMKGLMNPNEILFDWNFSRARQESLFPDESARPINMIAQNVIARDLYYFYSLIFYEDQDGNLYDTEHMLYFELDSLVTNGKLNLKINMEHHRDLYNSYTQEEKTALLNMIIQRNHPMVQYFSQDSQPSSKAIK